MAIKNCLYCKVEFKSRGLARKYCCHKCYAQDRVGKKVFTDIGGSKNPNWKGGKRLDKDGYVLIHCPYHPYCDGNGYVREHRLIMEKAVKRFVLLNEIVHHINETKNDNRIENLMLMGKIEHNTLHNKEKQNVR